MKKLISILLVMMMILCMGTTAFADTTNITIAGTDARNYNAYELLELTTSHKTTGTTCNGTTHTDACYNYSYTVNEDYREILKKEVFVNAKDVFWNTSNPKPTNADAVTDVQILDYLSKLAGDNDADKTYGTLRDAADRIYRAIKSTTPYITPDKTLQSGSNTGVTVDQGYWLIADVTNLDDAEEANSLVMVNTKGQDTLTIAPKTALPVFEKKVKDINESKDANFTNSAWADSADHDRVGVVPFKLTATVPANVESYDEYKLVFHDKTDNGLEVNDASIKVYKYDSKTAADADIVLNESNLVENSKYTLNTAPTDGCSFELTLTDVLDIAADVEAGTAFVVYYEATLTEAAVMGDDGNSNTAYLEFSNDPYNAEQTGKIEDTVKVFTYQLTINKVDEAGNALTGAGFTLYKKDSTGTYKPIGGEVAGGATFTWTHLDDGDYKLVESTVPAGYNKMDDLDFTISAEHDPDLTSLSGGKLGDGVVDTGLIEEPVTNYTGTILPSTGAQGTMMLIGGGSVFIVLAAVFMITRKKMSVYED